MNDNDFQHLPEFIQREVEDYRRREARDRIKVALFALFVLVTSLIAAVAIADHAGLGA